MRSIKEQHIVHVGHYKVVLAIGRPYSLLRIERPRTCESLTRRLKRLPFPPDEGDTFVRALSQFLIRDVPAEIDLNRIGPSLSDITEDGDFKGAASRIRWMIQHQQALQRKM